jgi:hypothetical protein
MKLNLKVDIGDGPFVVTTNLQTIIAWERKFRRKAGDLATGIGMEDLAFMAWERCKQSKIVVPVEFDSFVARLVELEVVSEENDAPFLEAPTDVR